VTEASPTVGSSFRDGFEAGRLDPDRWLPAYLPQWTTPERSAARHRFDGGRLVLEITEETLPWCPDHDGDVRVASIQTGVRSGPVGSPDGQHRFAAGLTVVTAQPTRRLYLPHFGRMSIRARAVRDPRAMVALWLIGFEDEPGESGEILVMEIFGRDVGADRATVGMGIRPHHDPGLRDGVAGVPLAIDVTAFHEYAIDWRPDGITWTVDDAIVHESDQAPDYPMQLMLGLYAFEALAPGESPLEFHVDRVSGDPLESHE
jgi:hypothetical protein